MGKSVAKSKDIVARRRRRTTDLLKALHIDDIFMRLSGADRDYIHNRVYPSPHIEFDGTAEELAETEQIADDVLAVMRQAKAPLPGTEFDLSAVEVFTILAKLIWCVRALDSSKACPAATRLLLDKLEPVWLHFMKDS